MTEERSCNDCGAIKPLTQFMASKRAKNGYSGRCKECQKERVYAWRAANRERYLELRRAETRRRTAAGKTTKWQLQKYGLTVEDFMAMSEAQGDVCAICGKGPTRQFRLSVDHCHESGEVRGLLCDPCNRILGMIKDSPEHAFSMGLYLEKHS